MIYLVSTLFSLLFVFPLNADGFDRSGQDTERESSNPASIESGSDAAFDKRLPPVLPGEHVNDSGRTMKVWSTAGPVPVSRVPEAPEPWNQQGEINAITEQVEVIVDRRKRGDMADAKAKAPSKKSSIVQEGIIPDSK